ncbi:MAG TPA: VOC family protein [Stellaceae bacterium]|nr:VOC family protein [Stellaceae bacterium]
MSRSGIAGIDHLLMPVRDLEAARMAWTRLGFALSTRGTHLGRGTGNYCIMFAQDYLELFGILTPDLAAPEYRAFLQEREGPMKLAWATPHAGSAATALAALGIEAGPVRDLARQIELPEGTAVPRFSLLALAPDTTPGLDSFLCAHLTPELMRRREWLDHPNSAVGLAGVTVAVADTRPLIAPYERLFGPANLHMTDDVLTLRVGRHRIIFATADDVAVMHPEIDESPAAIPSIAVVTIRVRDIERTADHLAQWQVPYESAGRNAVIVPSAEANGALLEFVAMPG